MRKQHLRPGKENTHPKVMPETQRKTEGARGGKKLREMAGGLGDQEVIGNLREASLGWREAAKPGHK